LIENKHPKFLKELQSIFLSERRIIDKNGDWSIPYGKSDRKGFRLLETSRLLDRAVELSKREKEIGIYVQRVEPLYLNSTLISRYITVNLKRRKNYKRVLSAVISKFKLFTIIFGEGKNIFNIKRMIENA
jgi:hypothetical protein